MEAFLRLSVRLARGKRFAPIWFRRARRRIVDAGIQRRKRASSRSRGGAGTRPRLEGNTRRVQPKETNVLGDGVMLLAYARATRA
jgi:hypothetical protein